MTKDVILILYFKSGLSSNAKIFEIAMQGYSSLEYQNISSEIRYGYKVTYIFYFDFCLLTH